MISIISACSRNRVIGIDNNLPWNLSEDLKRFKKITTGKKVVMGRKTFESIGRPLPNRTNIILTRDKNYKAEGVLVYNDINCIFADHDDFIVIGGSEIYNLFINRSDIIELTLIDKDFEGDSYFPELDSRWVEINRESHSNEEFNYYFITYKNVEN